MAMVVIVISDHSTISGGQWEEFGKKMKLGQITSKNFQDYLDNPGKFSYESVGAISLSQARKILGRDKVISRTDFNKVWCLELEDGPIFYSESDFLRASHENRFNGQDWRLIYCLGRSIKQLVNIIGTDEGQQPYCFQKQGWYLAENQSFWADVQSPAGYYLINFNGQFAGLDYHRQVEDVTKIGLEPFVEITNPHLFIEAVTTIFKLTGERITEDWYHRSPVRSANGKLVDVHFDSKGWEINKSWLDAVSDENLRVSVLKKQRI